jgi:hypothetical protein
MEAKQIVAIVDGICAALTQRGLSRYDVLVVGLILADCAIAHADSLSAARKKAVRDKIREVITVTCEV